MHLRLTMALRFMRSRRKGALTRFISFASTSGIALGVFAAIVGFSAMNGFEYELENRVLSVIPSAQLNSGEVYFKESIQIEQQLKKAPGIVASAPAFEQKAILVANQTFLPVNIVGIDPSAERKVVAIENFTSVKLDYLNPDYVEPEPAPPITPKAPAAQQKAQVGASSSSVANETADAAGGQPQHAHTVTQNGRVVEQSPFIPHRHVKTRHSSSSSAPAKPMDEEALAHLPPEVRQSILQAQEAEGNSELVAEHLPNFILGDALARKLGVEVGDIIEIYTLDLASEAKSEAMGIDYNHLKQVLQTPKKIRAKVVGLMKIGGQLDSMVALTHIECLQYVLGVTGPNTIHIRTKDINSTQQIVLNAISGKINENAYLTTWLSSHGKLYHDIQMVRQIMFLAMFLVLAVACFNIISNLMMMVGEKRREIAILLTMGMTPRNVIVTFSLMGLLSGGYGALIGVCLGVPFSLMLTPVTSRFKEWFGFDLLNPDVYFINFIPCRLEWLDLAVIVTVALCMSLGAALYPAYRAAHVKPAQELNM